MTVRPAKTQVSLGVRPVWSESSLCAQLVARDPSFLHADSEDWSDWADAQADLSLRWAHMPFCWFCQTTQCSLFEVCPVYSSPEVDLSSIRRVTLDKTDIKHPIRMLNETRVAFSKSMKRTLVCIGTSSVLVVQCNKMMQNENHNGSLHLVMGNARHAFLVLETILKRHTPESVYEHKDG